jgi:hypothetical protein
VQVTSTILSQLLIEWISTFPSILYNTFVMFSAKGKSGCPVRPPEPSTSSNNLNKVTLLDAQLDDVEGMQFNTDYLTVNVIIINPMCIYSEFLHNCR